MQRSPSTLLTSYTQKMIHVTTYILLREIKRVDQLLEDVCLSVDEFLLESLEQLCEPRDNDLLGFCLNDYYKHQYPLQFCCL